MPTSTRDIVGSWCYPSIVVRRVQLVWPLALLMGTAGLARQHTGPAAVLCNELDARCLQCFTDSKHFGAKAVNGVFTGLHSQNDPIRPTGEATPTNWIRNEVNSLHKCAAELEEAKASGDRTALWLASDQLAWFAGIVDGWRIRDRCLALIAGSSSNPAHRPA